MNIKQLLEYFDPVGWVISADGNKTRCKKSHYMINKRNYMSPWFQQENLATKWFNDYVVKKRPQATMTLYEVAEQAKDEIKLKNERLVKAALYNAQKTKNITQANLELIKQMVQLNGNDANQVDLLLKKNNIKVINTEQVNDSQSQYSGNVNKCEKCGSKELTTGLIDQTKGLASDNWMHKCLKCGHIMPIVPKIKESDTGGIAGFNSGFGEPDKIKIDKNGVKTRKSFKKKK